MMNNRRRRSYIRILMLSIIMGLVAHALGVQDLRGAGSSWHPFNIPFDGASISSELGPDNGTITQGIRVGTDGDLHLGSADGPKIRLFGTAIAGSAAFPDTTQAEQIATRLARLGFNFLKLSNFDSIFSSKDPPVFDATKRDRFFNFIGQLKDKGIYVGLTLPGCGGFDNSQPTALFMASNIQCQKDLASALLNEDPGVSGLTRLKDDPALALVQFDNEITLFLGFVSCELDPQHGCTTVKPEHLTETQSEVLDQKWNQKLLNHFGNRSNLESSWACTGKIGLRSDEDPAADSVERIEYKYDDGSFAFQVFCLQRVIDETTFYYQVEREYVQEMVDHLKNTLGLQIPITTIENFYGIADKMAQAETGVMAQHSPWVHPCTFSESCNPGGGFMVPPFQFINWPMVKGPVPADKQQPTNWPVWIERRNTIWRLATASAVKGKPYIISEYNHPLPNEFQAEFPLLISAYARFQGWDGIVLHSYAESISSVIAEAASEAGTNMIENGFEVADDPAILAQIPAAARLFRNDWISEANQTVTIPFWEDGGLDDDAGAINDWWDCLTDYYCYWEKVIEGVSKDLDGTVDAPVDPALSLIHKTEMEFRTSPTSASIPSAGSSPYVSDTNELRWDMDKGLLTIDTQWVNAAIGCLADGPNGCSSTNPNLEMLGINATTDFAAISVVPLDDQPLLSTNNLLLTAVGRIMNTNMDPAPPRPLGEQTFNSWGEAPVLLQPVEAQITLTLPQAREIMVYPLDEQGNKGTPLSSSEVQQSGDEFTFAIGTHETPWYLVEVTENKAVFRVSRSGEVFSDNAFFCGQSTNCFNVGTAADLAERIAVTEPVEPGDVVAIDPNRPHTYQKARQAYSPLVAGIIAARPGFVLGNSPEDVQSSGRSGSRSFSPLPIGERATLHALLGAPLTPNVVSPLDLLQNLIKPRATGIAALAGRLNRQEARALEGRPALALMGRVLVKATTENGPIRPGDLLVSASKPGYAMRCSHPEKCAVSAIGKALEPLEEGEGLIEVLVMQR